MQPNELTSRISMNTDAFEKELRKENYADNTIIAYKYAVREYYIQCEAINKENLLQVKTHLLENFKPKTVNLRIRGINKYLEFLGCPDLKIKMVKIPKSSFLDYVISNEDYLFFKSKLRVEKDPRWYFIVWTLATTGARISELVQIKKEHVRAGYYDIYSKGGRIRRIYLPIRLREELLTWIGQESGFLFVNRYGTPITPRGIADKLKELALKYRLNPDVVHPHSFRHLFALNFLAKSNDLALLADLLGHESMDTTRIYLQRSSREQKKLIDRVVDW